MFIYFSDKQNTWELFKKKKKKKIFLIFREESFCDYFIPTWVSGLSYLQIEKREAK